MLIESQSVSVKNSLHQKFYLHLAAKCYGFCSLNYRIIWHDMTYISIYEKNTHARFTGRKWWPFNSPHLADFLVVIGCQALQLTQKIFTQFQCPQQQNKKHKEQDKGCWFRYFQMKHVFQVGCVVDVVFKKNVFEHILAPHASQPMWCGRHLTQYTFGPTTNALANWPNLPMVQQPVSCFAMFPRNRALYSTHSPNGNWLSGNCSLTLVHDDFVSWNVATMFYTFITLQQAPPLWWWVATFQVSSNVFYAKQLECQKQDFVATVFVPPNSSLAVGYCYPEARGDMGVVWMFHMHNVLATTNIYLGHNKDLFCLAKHD